MGQLHDLDLCDEGKDELISFSYVEKKMIANGTDEVEFDDVVDYNKSRKVAATAFVSSLCPGGWILS